MVFAALLLKRPWVLPMILAIPAACIVLGGLQIWQKVGFMVVVGPCGRFWSTWLLWLYRR